MSKYEISVTDSAGNTSKYREVESDKIHFLLGNYGGIVYKVETVNPLGQTVFHSFINPALIIERELPSNE